MWITFSSYYYCTFCRLGRLNLLENEGIEIELDVAIGKTCQIGSYLLLHRWSHGSTVTRSRCIWLAVSSTSLSRSSLGSIVLQLFENLEKHSSIMAHRDALHRIWPRLRLLGYLRSIRYIVREIDVELETAHDGKMIPEFLLMVLYPSVSLGTYGP